MYYTYILRNEETGRYYIGLTSNLDQRIESYRLKYNLATKEFSDLKIVYKEKYSARKEAEKREKQLKRWSVAKT